MKVNGNQGMQQTINWVKESIETQLHQAKDLGRQVVDRVQNAFEQRLGGDRFNRSQHSGLDAHGLGDLAEGSRTSQKRRLRGKLIPGLHGGPTQPKPPNDGDHGHEGNPGTKICSAVGTKRPDIIQTPDPGVQGGGSTQPKPGRTGTKPIPV